MAKQTFGSPIRFEAIRAPQFDDSKVRIYLIGAMSSFAKTAIREFNKTTTYWSKKPKFEMKLSTSKTQSEVVVEVFTANPVYGYLDQGVKGHDIIPRKSRKSGTSGTFLAGSTPGTLSVNPAGGKKIIDGFYLNLGWIVPWPGIKPREFSRLVKEKIEKDSYSNLKTLIQSALDKSSSKLWRK